MDSPGLLPDSLEPPSSLNPSAPRPSDVAMLQDFEESTAISSSWTLAHLVGIIMAGLTLVLPLLAIMNYSASGLQSNPSLLLPVDTSAQ